MNNIVQDAVFLPLSHYNGLFPVIKLGFRSEVVKGWELLLFTQPSGLDEYLEHGRYSQAVVLQQLLVTSPICLHSEPDAGGKIFVVWVNPDALMCEIVGSQWLDGEKNDKYRYITIPFRD